MDGEGERERLDLKRKAEGLGGGDEGSREGDMVEWNPAKLRGLWL